MSYGSGTRLSGVIYLHNISKPRIEGSALENLEMFRKLCGDEALKNVILATTFWDLVDKAQGEMNVQELMTNDAFWGRMVKKGSRVFKLKANSSSSGFRILKAIKGHCALRAQVEIVDEGKPIRETEAASFTLSAAKKRLEEKFREDKEETRRVLAENQRKAEERGRRQLGEIQEQFRRQKEQQEIYEIERILKEEAEEKERQHKMETLRRKEEKKRQQLERLARQAKELEEEREREFERLKQEYYNTYVCSRGSVTSLFCDKCFHYISRGSWYYRKLSLDPKLAAVLMSTNCFFD